MLTTPNWYNINPKLKLEQQPTTKPTYNQYQKPQYTTYNITYQLSTLTNFSILITFIFLYSPDNITTVKNTPVDIYHEIIATMYLR